jgi:gliding motility-associated-like protein
MPAYFFPFFKQPVFRHCLTNGIIILIISLFALKTTAQNTTAWADSCVSTTFKGKVQSIYPNSFSEFYKVLNYPGGDVICIGRIKVNSTVSSGSLGLVMRISQTGIVKWSRLISYDGLQNYPDIALYEGVITTGGDIIITTDAHLIKLNGNGDLVWYRKLIEFTQFRSFQQLLETQDGGILAAGVTGSSTLIAKFDAQGILLWSRFYYNTYMSACNSITETTDAFYFIARGRKSSYPQDSSFNVLTKLNTTDGTIVWVKELGATPSNVQTEYSYDDIQFINNQLVISGFTNYDYLGPNPNSQSVVTIDLNGQIISAKKIYSSAFQVERSILFRNRLFYPKYNIGVQYSQQYDNGFGVYKKGNQNTIDWAVKYTTPGLMVIHDMEIAADTSIFVAGMYENYNNTTELYAFLIKTNSIGNVDNCPGTTLPITVTDDNIAVTPYDLLSLPTTPPGNLDANNVVVSPGQEFNFVVTCNNEANAQLGKISGLQNICTGSTALYKVTRGGTSVHPVQYTVVPATAAITVISDSSVSINFSTAGTYVLHAAMPSSCKTLQDSMVIQVISSPGVLNLGPDTTLCANNQLILHAKKGYQSYQWQDGSTDSVFTVTAPGKYYATVIGYCGETYSDTVNITEEVIAFNHIPDRTKCNADTLHLNAPAGFSNYKWTNNTIVLNTPNIVINPAATTNYFLTAEKRPGCLIYDTATITVLTSPVIYLGKDTGFCSGSMVHLTAGTAYSNYTWNTGAATAAIDVNTAGLYFVKATYSNGCTASDSINIIHYNDPVVSLGNDVILCIGVARVLQTTTPFQNYLWQNGSVQNTFTASQPGTYSVKVTDGNSCTGSAAITLIQSDCIPALYMPTAFTPNNDSRNDLIRPLIKGTLVQYHFTIMNRYGEKVFDSVVPNDGWDGNFKGLAQNSGGYVWFCEYQFTGKDKQFEKGYFLLIR